MLMKSYSFQKEVPSEVWELFKDVNKLSSGFDYSLEIINNAMTGNIRLDGNFNIAAYLGKVEKLKRMEGNRSAKKFSSIIDDVDEFVETGIPMSIPADKVTEYVEPKDEFEAILDEDEVHYAVKEINSMATQIMFNHNVDVIRCLQQALKGIPSSVELLKKLVNEDVQIGEFIQTILSSGQPFDEMFEGIEEVAS